MNAFVATPFLKCGSKTFHGQNVQSKPSTLTASVRMSSEKESSVFGKAGDSLWKENPFTGGFPGGEQFFKAWIDDGMTKDVPDMPDSMQSKTEFKPAKEKKSGVLALLDKTEFFNDFIGKGQTDPDDEDPDSEDSETAEEEKVDENLIPSESLYEAYFPASRRNIAPMINMVNEKDFVKDRVYLSMREVTASATDLYFPKETKNKAPIIEISYNGSSLNGASIKLSLDYVDNLPTLAPPPKSGEARASLVPGRGGGLKLEYSVAGEGVVNI